MAKYLDSTGLTYLWSKMLAAFAQQASVAAEINAINARLVDCVLETAEDGFYVTDPDGYVGFYVTADAQNNILVESNNNTMWVGTQTQYDALTTAQKESIIAFITG